jgi:DNA-directed RNA polymerase subunit RPC12/RpoP
MSYSCPDCAGPLQVSSSAGARTLNCTTCGGHLYGLAPFEHMLDDGIGATIWVAAAAGPPAGSCPYCSLPMHRPAGSDAGAAGIAVCRLCQEVWVPANGSEWLAEHKPARPSVATPQAPAVPAECSNCGAPYTPDEDGRCEYCKAQIAAPQPVVVMLAPMPDRGSRLF